MLLCFFESYLVKEVLKYRDIFLRDVEVLFISLILYVLNSYILMYNTGIYYTNYMNQYLIFNNNLDYTNYTKLCSLANISLSHINSTSLYHMIDTVVVFIKNLNQIIFTGIFYNFNSCIIFILPIIIIISIIDIKYRLVFDIDIFCGIIIEVVFFLCRLDARIIIISVTGGMILFTISYLISRFTGQMGMGDVLYFLLVGSLVGFRYCMWVFFVSFFVAFVYVIISMLGRRSLGDGLISFTPFISISLLILIFITF